MNAEQTNFLSRFGVNSVHDLTDPLRKLEYTEIDPSPDPTPVSSFNDAQMQYLGGRAVADLDEFQRDILVRMGPGPGAASPSVSVDPVKRSGAPTLDVNKLQSMPMSPTARLEVFEWFKVLETAHREAQRGVEPHLQSTRYEVERANMFCAPYLI